MDESETLILEREIDEKDRRFRTGMARGDRARLTSSNGYEAKWSADAPRRRVE